MTLHGLKHTKTNRCVECGCYAEDMLCRTCCAALDRQRDNNNISTEEVGNK